MKKSIGITAAVVLALVALVAAPMLLAGPQGKAEGHGAGMGMGGGMHRGMHGGDGGHGGFGMGLFGGLTKLKAELNLTEAQVAELKQIAEAHHAQNEPFRGEMKGGFKDVAALLLANPTDLAGAQALIDKQAAARRTMQINMLQATSKALNVLTPEQRALLAKKLEERSAKGFGHGRRGMMH